MPCAISLSLCAASTRVSRWVFLLFFDLSHRRSSWSNSISVGRLFRGRPEQVFALSGRVGRVLRALRGTGSCHTISINASLGGFAFLEERRGLAPLWLNYFDVRHSPSAGTVRYNYITQKVGNEGCPKSYMQKKYFLVSVKFLCPINNILYGSPIEGVNVIHSGATMECQSHGSFLAISCSLPSSFLTTVMAIFLCASLFHGLSLHASLFHGSSLQPQPFYWGCAQPRRGAVSRYTSCTFTAMVAFVSNSKDPSMPATLTLISCLNPIVNWYASTECPISSVSKFPHWAFG